MTAPANDPTVKESVTDHPANEHTPEALDAVCEEFGISFPMRNEWKLARGVLDLSAQLAARGAELESYKSAMRVNSMTADAPYLARHLKELCDLLGIAGAEGLPYEVKKLQAQLTAARADGELLDKLDALRHTEIDRDDTRIARTSWEFELIHIVHDTPSVRDAIHALIENTRAPGEVAPSQLPVVPELGAATNGILGDLI